MAITKTDAGAAPDSSGPGPDNAKSRGQLAQVQQMADFYPAITGRWSGRRVRVALVVDRRQESVRADSQGWGS